MFSDRVAALHADLRMDHADLSSDRLCCEGLNNSPYFKLTKSEFLSVSYIIKMRLHSSKLRKSWLWMPVVTLLWCHIPGQVMARSN